MQNFRALWTWCAFAAIFFCATAFSTLSTESGLMYVELSELSVDNYDELYNLLKTNNQFELKEACIPAHVVSIRLKQANSAPVQQQFESFKQLIGGAGLHSASLLTSFDDAQFLDRCKGARGSR